MGKKVVLHICDDGIFNQKQSCYVYIEDKPASYVLYSGHHYFKVVESRSGLNIIDRWKLYYDD